MRVTMTPLWVGGGGTEREGITFKVLTRNQKRKEKRKDEG